MTTCPGPRVATVNRTRQKVARYSRAPVPCGWLVSKIRLICFAEAFAILAFLMGASAIWVLGAFVIQIDVLTTKLAKVHPAFLDIQGSANCFHGWRMDPLV